MTLFESHLPVVNLDNAVEFYRDRLGLTLAHVVPDRQAAFLWIGSPGAAMLGLWRTGANPQRTTLHIAFGTSVAHVLAAPATLRGAGITPLDFNGQPANEPDVLAWMPAASIYFHDPDGHLLEYVAMLPDQPRPDLGVIPWNAWEATRRR